MDDLPRNAGCAAILGALHLKDPPRKVFILCRVWWLPVGSFLVDTHTGFWFVVDGQSIW
jgi:hypothetical protein